LTGVRVVAVDAGTGRELRMAVLRPEQDPAEPMYAREHHPSTLHFAALGEGEKVLAVGSAMPDAHPREPRPGDWRVRGMATDPRRRGRGLGAQVLATIEAAARERGAVRLWCNARTPARGFYERAGFAAEGEEFEIAGIGPHFLMAKALG
jgi:GNAT superfamily N-acetyltransferase